MNGRQLTPPSVPAIRPAIRFSAEHRGKSAIADATVGENPLAKGRPPPTIRPIPTQCFGGLLRTPLSGQKIQQHRFQIESLDNDD
ncbi:MAG: hypothetical protein LBF88_02910 [Planctomycetaceae bacterium]|nr:hypothetical protein [Planctomycetaceae bacterium]